jgi:hypothetical protein
MENIHISSSELSQGELSPVDWERSDVNGDGFEDFILNDGFVTYIYLSNSESTQVDYSNFTDIHLKPISNYLSEDGFEFKYLKAPQQEQDIESLSDAEKILRRFDYDYKDRSDFLFNLEIEGIESEISQKEWWHSILSDINLFGKLSSTITQTREEIEALQQEVAVHKDLREFAQSFVDFNPDYIIYNQEGDKGPITSNIVKLSHNLIDQESQIANISFSEEISSLEPERAVVAAEYLLGQTNTKSQGQDQIVYESLVDVDIDIFKFDFNNKDFWAAQQQETFTFNEDSPRYYLAFSEDSSWRNERAINEVDRKIESIGGKKYIADVKSSGLKNMSRTEYATDIKNIGHRTTIPVLGFEVKLTNPLEYREVDMRVELNPISYQQFLYDHEFGQQEFPEIYGLIDSVDPARITGDKQQFVWVLDDPENFWVAVRGMKDSPSNETLANITLSQVDNHIYNTNDLRPDGYDPVGGNILKYTPNSKAIESAGGDPLIRFLEMSKINSEKFKREVEEYMGIFTQKNNLENLEYTFRR